MFPLSNPTRAWFIVLAVAYFLLYGWFLWYSDFLPYVLDNNETFSSLVHAANLYHFGIEKTFGLTDEAYGMSAAAHPYVYTHQGNFPRLFALLLYALGATSAESQIFLTTFTIGFLGICFAYSVFRRIVDEAFAVILCFLLMTDYVMFAQWQVNTWQVWHVFFFFSSLMCVFGLHQGRRALWIPVSILNFSCLIYYELLFALFVFTFCGVYASYLYRRNLKTLALTLGTLVGGGITGASVLVAQNIAYLGWDNFLTDLKLTYIGRNIAGSDENLIAQLKAFYEQNNIVFWHNIFDAGPLRSLPEIGQRFFKFGLITYTPLLVLITAAVGFAWLIANVKSDVKPVSHASLGDAAEPGARITHRLTPIDGSIFLAAAFTTFAASVLVDSAVIGLVAGSSNTIYLVGQLVVLLLLSLLTFMDFRRLLRSDPTITSRRVILALLFLLLVAAFVRVHRGLYDPSYAPLWRDLAASFGSVYILQFFVIATVWLSTRLILNRAVSAELPRSDKQLGVLGPYLLCGLAAYAVTAFLLPGYLKTVYFDRFAPLTVFFHLVPFALLLYALGAHVVAGVRSIAMTSRARGAVGDAAAPEPQSGPLAQQTESTIFERKLTAVALDTACVASAWFLAYLFRFSFDLPEPFDTLVFKNMVWVLPIHAAVFVGAGLYREASLGVRPPDAGKMVIAAFLPSALISLGLMVTGLSPGIPRAVLLLCPLLLLPLLILSARVMPGLSKLLAPWFRTAWRRILPFLPQTESTELLLQTACAAIMLVFATAYWAALQSVYLDRLPPDHFAFLRKLQEPPFAGESFAVNTYAAPVAVTTGSWAYFDSALGQGAVQITEEGIEIIRNLNLLWFADKRVNPEYLEPKYFLCIRSQYFISALRQSQPAGYIPSDGCSKLQLVQKSRMGSMLGFQNDVMVMDNTGRDRWAIVRLDWDYPPYLRPLDQTGRTIIAEADYQKPSGSKGPRIAFVVRYLFAQKDGRPEGRSLYSLYAARHTERQCVQAGDMKLFKRSEKIADLDLPPSFTGIAQIKITPRTETKTGVEYSSEIVHVGRAKAACVPS